MTEEDIVKLCPTRREILKYGKYIVDEWFVTNEPNSSAVHNTWVRIIKYNGCIYYSKTVDGESIEFKELI